MVNELEYTKKFIYLSNQWYNDGLKKANIRDLSGAILSLKKSLQYNRDNVAARNLLGLAYYGRGEVVEALVEWVISKNMRPNKNIVDDYIKAVQSNPAKLEEINQSIKKYNLALNYCQQGSIDLAVIQLKKVLLVTFFTMILLPLLLFTVTICVAGLCRLNFIQNSYGIENLDYQHVENSMQLLSELTKNIHKELEQTAQEDADKFNDAAFLAQIDKRLEDDSSSLVVRKGHEFVYIGNITKMIATLSNGDEIKFTRLHTGKLPQVGDVINVYWSLKDGIPIPTETAAELQALKNVKIG